MPVSAEDLDGALTAREAADVLQISYRTLTRLVEAHQIEVIRIGNGRGRIFVSRRSLTDYINRRNIKADRTPIGQR